MLRAHLISNGLSNVVGKYWRIIVTAGDSLRTSSLYNSRPSAANVTTCCFIYLWKDQIVHTASTNSTENGNCCEIYVAYSSSFLDSDSSPCSCVALRPVFGAMAPPPHCLWFRDNRAFTRQKTPTTKPQLGMTGYFSVRHGWPYKQHGCCQQSCWVYRMA